MKSYTNRVCPGRENLTKRVMTSLGDHISSLVLLLLFDGAAIYFIRDIVTQFKAQAEYERAFIERHQDFINRQQNTNTRKLFKSLTSSFPIRNKFLIYYPKQASKANDVK